MRKPTIWVSDKSDIKLELLDILHYPCTENKGAAQLCSYCEADLRLCFRICRLLVSLWRLILLPLDKNYIILLTDF